MVTIQVRSCALTRVGTHNGQGLGIQMLFPITTGVG